MKNPTIDSYFKAVEKFESGLSADGRSDPGSYIYLLRYLCPEIEERVRQQDAAEMEELMERLEGLLAGRRERYQIAAMLIAGYFLHRYSLSFEADKVVNLKLAIDPARARQLSIDWSK